ncbi:hypothetical protein U9M48_042547 [Paspalum notatum var. saurae]|uniref:Transposase n=1 Tax=Paspalum notatum var. saurae TaxID=547442 RepID=A0AAQ3XHQ3_PASNO
MPAARESWKMVEVRWPRNEATVAALDAVCDGLQRPCQCLRRDIVSDLLLSRSAWLVSQPWLHGPTLDHRHARLNHQDWVGNGVRDLQLHPQGVRKMDNGAKRENRPIRFSKNPEGDPLGQENEENGSNLEGDPLGHQNEENGSNLGGDSHSQWNAHRLYLSNEKRRQIFDSLLAKATNGEMIGHETTEVSAEFLSSRTTIADVATHFGVSKAKIHSMKREGVIKRVSNTLKPYLTEKNKKDQLKWCLSMLDPLSLPHDPEFKGLFDHVVIDEKWWFITRKTERYYTAPGEVEPTRTIIGITRKTERYYTAPGEVEPTRTIRNKNYIPKIQILTAVGRPRFDSEGRCIFDAKIGCWAFFTYEPAKRSSVNRPAGTIEMKPIESITKDVMRSFMIEKVLPAIRAKWPREDVGKPIYIQQDNAKPHVAPTDRLFSIQHKKTSKTTEELVAIVNKAFEEYSVDLSNRIFLTLHGCMKEVMKISGGNSYDVPHIRKGCPADHCSGSPPKLPALKLLVSVLKRETSSSETFWFQLYAMLLGSLFICHASDPFGFMQKDDIFWKDQF